MSLESDGHDYLTTVKKRRHVAEDLAALKKVAAAFPFVTTTESRLHRLTGLPLYEC